MGPQESDNTTAFAISNGQVDDISNLMFGWTLPLFIGIPGNIFALIVANMKENRRLSPCHYMAAMSVADSILLIEGGAWSPIMNKLLIDTGVWKYPEFPIVFHIYVLYASGMLSGFFLAFMSMDRLVAVRWPMRAKILCTPKKARVTIVLTSFIVIGVNTYIFKAFKYARDPMLGINMVIITIPGYPLLEMLASLFQVVFGTFVPFFIILGANIMIIITLQRASKERRSLEKGNSERLEKDTRYLTRMLLFVSFAYFIVTLPYRLYHLVLKIPAIATVYDLTDIAWRKRYVIEAWGLANVWAFNFAINFYLYCIGGGRKYRDDVRAILNNAFSCCTN